MCPQRSRSASKSDVLKWRNAPINMIWTVSSFDVFIIETIWGLTPSAFLDQNSSLVRDWIRYSLYTVWYVCGCIECTWCMRCMGCICYRGYMGLNSFPGSPEHLDSLQRKRKRKRQRQRKRQPAQEHRDAKKNKTTEAVPSQSDDVTITPLLCSRSEGIHCSVGELQDFATFRLIECVMGKRKNKRRAQFSSTSLIQ